MQPNSVSATPMSDKPLSQNILTLSANSETELDEVIEEYKKYLKVRSENEDQSTLMDIAYSLSTGRPHRPHRAVVIGTSCKDVLCKLENEAFDRALVPDKVPKLCFLFTGHGGSYHMAGRTLYETSPFYKENFDYCDKTLKSAYNVALKDTMFGDDQDKLDESIYSSGCQIFLEHCLAQLWERWGVKPDCILGHSLGEYPAATTAGMLTLDELIMVFGDMITGFFAKLSPGGMVALFTNRKTAEDLINQFTLNNRGADLWLEIAVTNSSTQTVVAGSPDSVQVFLVFCKTKGVNAYVLPMPYAYHSRGIDSSINDFQKSTELVKCRPPKCEYVSSKEGRLIDQVDSQYWADHIRTCCQFREASQSVYELEARVFLEIGVQPIQSAMMMQNVDEIDNAEPITCLPSMTKKGGEWTVLLHSLGQLYLFGYPIDWDGFYRDYNTKTTDIPFPVPKLVVQLDSAHFWEHLDQTKQQNERKKIIQQYLAKIVKSVLVKFGLSVEQIEPDTEFTQLGIDSLMGIQIKALIQRILGSEYELSFNDLVDCYTLDQLSNKVYQIIYTKSEKESGWTKPIRELAVEDSVLWPHIQVGQQGPCPLAEIKTYLLTGVTGNLAPYMLEILTKRPQTEKVYCIVREGRNESIEQRLESHLKMVKLWDKIDMSKVKAIKGDVPNEFLGMSKNLYENLAEEVDAIINSATASNHLAQYKKEDMKYGGVRAVNVIGTQRVFEFAGCRKTKWVYHASTFLSMWSNNIAGYERIPEVWPNFADMDFDKLPNFGYGMSKLIADDLAGQAAGRGIPTKSFRFPKINGDTVNGRQLVMKNHFFLKFLYYIISGVMPDIEVPLVLLPVDTCAELSLRVFFDERAPSDIYNVMNPHHIMETEVIPQLGEEFGPQLRVLFQIRRLVETVGEDAAREQWKNMTTSGPLSKLVREFEIESQAWIDDPSIAFKNDKVKKFIEAEFGFPLKVVEYDHFLEQLVKDGEESLIFNWIEFYTKEDSLIRLSMDGKMPLANLWRQFREKTFAGGKVETLYPNLKDIVESPMETLQRDIQFTIDNAKDIFYKKV